MKEENIKKQFKKFLEEDVLINKKEINVEDINLDLLEKIISKATNARNQMILLTHDENKTYKKLTEIAHSNLSEEMKYNLIFSNDIYYKLLSEYPKFHFEDTDSSYGEDVKALYEQITSFINQQN